MSGSGQVGGIGSSGDDRARFAGPQGNVSLQQQQQQRKRNRVRFSCNMCRDKKLKCNRVLPCDQCEKRGLGAVCQYMPYTSYSSAQDDNNAAGASMSASTATGAAPMSLKRQHSLIEQAYAEFEREFDENVDTAVGYSEVTVDRNQQQQQPAVYHDQQYHSTMVSQHPGHREHHTESPNAVAPSYDQSCHTQIHDTHDHSNQSVPERLKYLELLVKSLRARSTGPLAHGGQLNPKTRPVVKCEDDIIDNDVKADYDDIAVDTDPSDTSPTIVNETASGTAETDARYADPANWEGVLDDVVQHTNDLVLVDGGSHMPSAGHWDMGPQANNSLSLLAGGFPRVTTAEVFRYLPPRPIADLLIRRFFQGSEPILIMFHRPSFYRRYESFCDDPRPASYSYLALLFMMISHAAIFCLRSDEPVPGGLGDALDVIDACRHRAAHCLTLDDYSRPGRHKVEAMILYFGAEYEYSMQQRRRQRQQRHQGQKRQTDNAAAASLFGTAMILSMAVRLAMHMGYHRDPTHYGDKRLSPFEGEMRRRTWAVLVDMDKTVTYECGLPANAHTDSSTNNSNDEDCDTALPRNLYDSDLDEAMKELPPSRPEATERTPTLYTIVKARLLAVLADIMQLRVVAIESRKPETSVASSSSSLSSASISSPPPHPPPQPPQTSAAAAAATTAGALYEKRVLVLDRRLRAVHDNLPECLRLRGSSPSLASLSSSSTTMSGDSKETNDETKRATKGSKKSGSGDNSEKVGENSETTAAAAATTTRGPLDPRDPLDLCIQRYLLEIAYQRSRLVLHRRFLAAARVNARYAYSRWVCIDAATRTLQHQYDLYVAMQPGGRLSRDRWLADSAIRHDFLLANMVLCVGVTYARLDGRSRGAGKAGTGGKQGKGPVLDVGGVPLHQLLALLRTSRCIWATQREASREADRAYQMLTRMLADNPAESVDGNSNHSSAAVVDETSSPATTTTSASRSTSTTTTTRTAMAASTAATVATREMLSAPTPATTVTMASTASTASTTSTSPSTSRRASRAKGRARASTRTSSTQILDFIPEPMAAPASSLSSPPVVSQAMPLSSTSPWLDANMPQMDLSSGIMDTATIMSIMPDILDMPAMPEPPSVPYGGMVGVAADGATTTSGNYAVVAGMMPSLATDFPMQQYTSIGGSNDNSNSSSSNMATMDNDYMEGISDPTYAVDWNLWGGQLQGTAAEIGAETADATKQIPWNEFFAGGGGVNDAP